MMKHAMYISLFLLLCLAESCTNDRMISISFDTAERLMHTQPDSTLHILQTLDEQHILHGAQKARFALLYYEALEKNDLAFPNDTLIENAIDYYNSQRDYQRLGLALFYQGKRYLQRDSITKAMFAFLQSEKMLQRYRDEELLGTVNFEMALLYQEQHNYKEALTHFQQSLALFQKTDNKKEEGHLLLKNSRPVIYFRS